MNTVSNYCYITGGVLHPDAPSYVERQADRELYDGLIKSEFCHVITARQLGKSSLMGHTARRLREQGITVVTLDLCSIGWNLTPEQWYDGLSIEICEKLRLEDECEEFWQSKKQLQPLQRFMTCLREVIMPRRQGPVVIFVDNIDMVLSLLFCADEFFSAIHEWYNRRAQDSEFNRLTFCLLGEVMACDLIHDTSITLFNTGRGIELDDFTPGEAAPLANGLRREAKLATGLFERFLYLIRGLSIVASTAAPEIQLLERILYWTNGHPYLTQHLCRAVAQDSSVSTSRDVDRLSKDLFLSNRAEERQDNLVFVRSRLLLYAGEKTADFLRLYESVWRGKAVRDDEANPLVRLLRMWGVVMVVEGRLQVRNRIYQRVFNSAWIRKNMPA